MFNFIRSVASNILHKVADIVAPAKSEMIPELTQVELPKFLPSSATRGSELPLKDLIKDPNLGVSFDPKLSLDLECILRDHCERSLLITSPTNLAIFLPTTCGDYSLGAFVNYEKPKVTIESMLEDLGDKLAKPVVLGFESGALLANKLKAFTPDEREELFSGQVFGLDDKYFLLAPIVAQGEVLGIVTMFRDENPFQMDQSRANFLVEELGARLARVVKIHHRHLAPEDWGDL